uniref:Alpha-ketoglutarate-dependent dioxygenase AlkB-like domain-containing protein n=1 Tax=Trichuris muris TaxID=70415 RepID=A0A5S6QJ72_TRIMR
MENFISKEEEADLQSTMDSVGWQSSQSGRRKQDYGPRANFKKRKVKPALRQLPEYAEFLFQRLTKVEALSGFVPVELTNLDYDSSRGSWIDFHKDDCWLWGDRIVTCNLLSDTVLSFLEDTTNTLLYVPLKRRSLCCFSGNVRAAFKHGIFPQHIVGRRIVMTVREPSSWWQSGQLENDGIP